MGLIMCGINLLLFVVIGVVLHRIIKKQDDYKDEVYKTIAKMELSLECEHAKSLELQETVKIIEEEVKKEKEKNIVLMEEIAMLREENRRLKELVDELERLLEENKV